MATAKKTASGMWKCRAYSHTDDAGKKHYRAFTAPTKQEAEQAAARFSGTADRAARVDLTVAEAIDGYIRSREGVLSPSTILGYKRMQESRYDTINARKIRKLTSVDVQTFISEHAKTLSPKTVSNIYGLLCSSVALYAPEIQFRVKLPATPKKRPRATDDANILTLFNTAAPILRKCIALGAFTSLRRGEISALKFGDIQNGSIHVHADMVKGPDGWVYKPTPKTADSDRIVPVPDAIIELLGTGPADDFIIPWKPDTITKRFIDHRNACGLPDIRFHDLRHYYASIAASLIPDIYTEAFGGWRHGSRVMKEVYQGQIDPLADQYGKKMTGYFDGILKSMT